MFFKNILVIFIKIFTFHQLISIIKIELYILLSFLLSSYFFLSLQHLTYIYIHHKYLPSDLHIILVTYFSITAKFIMETMKYKGNFRITIYFIYK